MNLLVIGGGGREHALVWKLAQSPRVEKIHCTPGNPGIARIADTFPSREGDFAHLIAEARRRRIDLTVVGPERPLAQGIADAFRSEGLAVFGPTRRAAELEWSKAFAKEFMSRHGIPSAAFRVFPAGHADEARAYVAAAPLPVVIKADGLAAGKGVMVCATRGEATRALEELADARVFGNAASALVVEEWMQGPEASVFALSNGTGFVTLAPAQDHKRALDGDRGKNTGGMGAYAPAPCVTSGLLEEIERRIIRPTLEGMAAEGRPYTGCLYVGLMLTAAGPKVVEFNCRFGDPETQVVLPLLEGDLAELLASCAAGGELAQPGPPRGCAVCVVLASGGYPGAFQTGKVISGEPEGREGLVCFHAGTKRGEDGSLLTAGGRVIGVTAVRPEGGISAAIADAYGAVAQISFEGMHFRRDIGKGAFA